MKALAANGDKFKSLQEVYLRNNKITDEGVKALAANGDKFKSLQTVYLSGNKITQSCLTQLKSQYKLKFSISTWVPSSDSHKMLSSWSNNKLNNKEVMKWLFIKLCIKNKNWKLNKKMERFEHEQLRTTVMVQAFMDGHCDSFSFLKLRKEITIELPKIRQFWLAWFARVCLVIYEMIRSVVGSLLQRFI